MGIETVGPRIAFTPEGDVLFFDQNGEIIPSNQVRMHEKDFFETVSKKELQAYGSISFFSLKGSECKIVIVLPDNTKYCLKVDCTTGAIIGSCS